ncbi:MAG TPA: 1,4-dihydroxy-2-naphthoate polyprenyltransferase [Polyangiaceae bacterium]|nr:1,4-dihydroxy-2-naphthoate polyprenyltransferase [Polyangiaceae bacterium]
MNAAPGDDGSAPGGAAPQASPAAPRPSTLAAWVLAARPKTLLAAITPVWVGSACAMAVDAFEWLPAVAALVGAMLLQVASNFANDVFDYEKGADTAARLGPARAVAAGWLTPRAMRGGLAVVLALLLLVGAYLVSVAGPVLLLIGAASIVSAVAYTGGPYPLGYHGLGDIFVMIFFGFVAVAGTVYVQAGSVPALAWLSALPVGCLATAILVVNNVRDVETDRVAGKRTLPARFGRRFGVIEYWTLLVVSYAALLHPTLGGATGAFGLLPVATVPLAWRLGRRLSSERGAALNQVLARTALLLFVFGALLGVAIVLGAA